MRIILNADGFGRDEDTYNAAIECFQAGALSSATIAAAHPQAKQAIDYALKHPEFSFGVHLETVNSDDALKSAKGQIATLMASGVPVSHVTYDEPLPSTSRSLNTLAQILRQHSIKRVRSVPDMYISKPRMIFGRWIDSMARKRIRNRFITTDRLFVPKSIEDARAMQNWMPPVTDESLEVGVSPGFADETWSAHRQAIQSFARRALEAGHHLITWNQL
jgi:hypothetical protein